MACETFSSILFVNRHTVDPRILRSPSKEGSFWSRPRLSMKFLINGIVRLYFGPAVQFAREDKDRTSDIQNRLSVIFTGG